MGEISNQFLEEVKNRVTTLYRLDKADNMVPNPTDQEFRAAILSAIDEINLSPPVTQFSIDSFLNNQNLKGVLILFVAKNIIETIISEWVSNGMELSVEDLSVPDRLDRYQSLLEEIKNKCQNGLEALKGSMKTVRVRGIKSSSYRGGYRGRMGHSTVHIWG